MMEKTNFEKLRVYQKSEQLADEIWSIVVRWDYFAKDTVGKQLVRAADSVTANIAEGTGRGSRKEKKHFARVARGSLYETKNWLRRAHRRGLLSEEQVNVLKPLIGALAPMLNAYLRSLSTPDGERTRTKHEEPRPKPHCATGR